MAASRTCCLAALLTGAELLITREAVAIETPAALATSASVGAACWTTAGSADGVCDRAGCAWGSADDTVSGIAGDLVRRVVGCAACCVGTVGIVMCIRHPSWIMRGSASIDQCTQRFCCVNESLPGCIQYAQ